MLWLVKNTNGPTRVAEMRALGLVDDQTPESQVSLKTGLGEEHLTLLRGLGQS